MTDRRQRDPRGQQRRRAQRYAPVGWVLVGLAVAGYLVNEMTADIPAVHYALFAVMFVGAWLGFRAWR